MGAVPPGCTGTGLEAQGAGRLAGDRVRHPGRLVPAAVVSRELGIRLIETVCVAQYDYDKQGEVNVLKEVSQSIVDLDGGDGAGVLIVDDLVDTGATAKVVRAMLPKAHFATVYAKPAGVPLVDTFITEVSQDTWIFLPLGHGAAIHAAARRRQRGVTFAVKG